MFKNYLFQSNLLIKNMCLHLLMSSEIVLNIIIISVCLKWENKDYY